MSYQRWGLYVPVAERRAKARKKTDKLRKKGIDIHPVEITGRTIARTFWGKAWCSHLESFSDYANRLPRGRTYVRNGSVCHLDIQKGEIKAMVSGSSLYDVHITVKPLSRKKWSAVKKQCAGQIGSIIELLQGKISDSVMSIVTDRDTGLFPKPREIDLQCSCPDWASMCKHVAATLYGVGARLDENPELLFLLRGVDLDELIEAEVDATATVTEKKSSRRSIADDALGDVFGIEISKETGAPPAQTENPIATPKPASRKRSRGRIPTGKSVASLRAKFGMSQREFARLVGVSVPSVGKWEKQSGTLKLQRRTLDALTATKKLTKQEARKKLDHSSE